MNNLQRKKLNYLNDTVKYYKTHKRGMNTSGTCSYCSSSGTRCNIGRKVSIELAKKLESMGGNVGTLFEHLPKNLQIFGKDFLQAIQCFHDNNDFWIKTTKGNNLSINGQICYHEIATNILKNIY